MKPLLLLSLLLSVSAHASPLSLSAYLEQVRTGNTAYQASQNSKEGGLLRQDEGDMQTAWTLFSNLTFIHDSKLPMSVITPYDTMLNQAYQVGISKQWTFGLLSKVSYNWSGTSYINAIVSSPFPGVTIGAVPSFNAYPLLELSMPLLANGFGSSVRAAQTMTEASALASSYGAAFQGKVIASSAEATYWRLSVARRTLALSRETLERTQKIADWNARRVRMQLADQGDALQSSAGLQQAKLSLQSAEDEVRNASRAFNSARNMDTQEVSEELEAFDAALINKLAIPTRVEKRDDVKAAEQSMRISDANAKISIEKNWPALDVFGSMALNGQPAGTPTAASYPTNFTDSMKNSFSLNRPTYTVGLRLNVPLYFLTQNDARKAWFKEQLAADLNYTRKVYEQEQTWNELTTNFTQAKKKLEIARELESIQKEKLTHQRSLYDRGRATTFQLLSYENDYFGSQLARLRSEFDVISIMAQLKLFAQD